MNEKLNYISDDELERLMLQVEQEELVAAPPDLLESILVAAGLAQEMEQETSTPAPIIAPVKSIHTKKKEFYAYCFRVITSVAAAVVMVFLLPELPVSMQQPDAKPVVGKQEIPRYEEVTDTVPARNEVIGVGQTPTKEEVLDNTGFIERVLNNTGWFNKHHSED